MSIADINIRFPSSLVSLPSKALRVFTCHSTESTHNCAFDNEDMCVVCLSLAGELPAWKRLEANEAPVRELFVVIVLLRLTLPVGDTDLTTAMQFTGLYPRP